MYHPHISRITETRERIVSCLVYLLMMCVLGGGVFDTVAYAQSILCPSGTRITQVSGVSRCAPVSGYVCPRGMVLGYVSRVFVCNPRVNIQFWKTSGTVGGTGTTGTVGGTVGGVGGTLTNAQIEALVRQYKWATSTDSMLTFGVAKNGCTIQRGGKSCRLPIAWNGTIPGIQIVADNIGFPDTTFTPKVTPGTTTIMVGYQTTLRATQQGTTRSASHFVHDVVRCASGSVFDSNYVCVWEDAP